MVEICIKPINYIYIYENRALSNNINVESELGYLMMHVVTRLKTSHLVAVKCIVSILELRIYSAAILPKTMPATKYHPHMNHFHNLVFNIIKYNNIYRYYGWVTQFRISMGASQYL